MTLFKTEDIKRYFGILEKLGRGTETKYDGKCQKEIFVRRTLDKWFKNKDIVLYDINESEIEFLNYLHIISIRYHLGYSDEIDVTALSYNKNYQWELKKIGYNDALDLEGVWSENSDVHKKVLELTSHLSLPNREYVYQTYDWSLYPKRVRDKERAKEKIKGKHSFFGRTIRSVEKQVKEFRQNSKIMIGELLEIKETNN